MKITTILFIALPFLFLTKIMMGHTYRPIQEKFNIVDVITTKLINHSRYTVELRAKAESTWEGINRESVIALGPVAPGLNAQYESSSPAPGSGKRNKTWVIYYTNPLTKKECTFELNAEERQGGNIKSSVSYNVENCEGLKIKVDAIPVELTYRGTSVYVYYNYTITISNK